MFAIAFDLVVADTAANHPKGVSQAYADIGGTLLGFGFDRVQGSLYLTNRDDLANFVRRYHGTERVAMVSCLGQGHTGIQGRALVRFLPSW